MNFAVEICQDMGQGHKDRTFSEAAFLLICIQNVNTPVKETCFTGIFFFFCLFFFFLPCKFFHIAWMLFLLFKRVLAWLLHCFALPRNKRKNENSRKASKPGLSQTFLEAWSFLQMTSDVWHSVLSFVISDPRFACFYVAWCLVFFCVYVCF